ncbi:hypothetical protein DFP94_1011382 [Fontibacillus phaseoli]|uniref:Uncharacterized protein n=1 Tax=Fontibacillus phaseoli TaxID=1416533 RepID=A0A369BQ70_9BACL|nr:hypothetical protein [Fontibacillus phaseoli]RCX23780.1 hypothetical protein DFP94_1011382 [Fontibacillus phaseoli]
MARRRKKRDSSLPLKFPTTYENKGYAKDTFAKYLVLYPAASIRFHSALLVCFMLNVFVLIPVLGNPYQTLYAYILIPPLAAMNLWALALILQPRRLQLNYVLFRGSFGVTAALSFMITNLKFAYGMLGLVSPWYGILSFVFCFIGFFCYAKAHIQKLKSPPESRKNQSSRRNGYSTASMISAAAGLGCLAANLSLGFATQQMVAVVLMCVYTLLTFVLFHFIMDLHRYYWLNKCRHLRG